MNHATPTPEPVAPVVSLAVPTALAPELGAELTALLSTAGSAPSKDDVIALFVETVLQSGRTRLVELGAQIKGHQAKLARLRVDYGAALLAEVTAVLKSVHSGLCGRMGPVLAASHYAKADLVLASAESLAAEILRPYAGHLSVSSVPLYTRFSVVGSGLREDLCAGYTGAAVVSLDQGHSSDGRMTELRLGTVALDGVAREVREEAARVSAECKAVRGVYDTAAAALADTDRIERQARAMFARSAMSGGLQAAFEGAVTREVDAVFSARTDAVPAVDYVLTDEG